MLYMSKNQMFKYIYVVDILNKEFEEGISKVEPKDVDRILGKQ